MRVTKFWAKGFRSLREISLEPLGEINVFYGANGVGKSNLIDALRALFAVMPLAVDTAYESQEPGEERSSFREAGRRAATWIKSEDFDARQPRAPIVLGAVLEDSGASFGNASYRSRKVSCIEVEVRLSRPRPGELGLQFTRLLVDGERPGLPFSDPSIRDLLGVFVPAAFSHLGTIRTLGPDDDLVRKLFEAKNAADRDLRIRFEQVRGFMSQSLHRGLFDVFLEPDTQRLELREALPEPNPQKIDIRIDRAGLGIVQVYAIVAPILLSGSPLVALEEPEAHLHAPSTGRMLRALLSQMVTEKRVHQLFIATHSNLFDLDPTGYWDVSLDSITMETRVHRAELHEIDVRHLYEPGPAKHAILQLLRYATKEEVIFRRLDGSTVSAGEMLRHLQDDDDEAVEFLRTLHGAALRIVRLDARKKDPVQ